MTIGSYDFMDGSPGLYLTLLDYYLMVSSNYVESSFSKIMHVSQLFETWNIYLDMVTAEMTTFQSEIKLMSKLRHAKKSR